MRRKCTSPACYGLAAEGSRLCTACGERKPRAPPRASAAARGYDWQWRKPGGTRDAFLACHPLCQDCQAAGRMRPATEVHHVERIAAAPQRKRDWRNLRALCRACHSRRTAKGE